MAKVQNTLIGRASGSIGGATFTTWKGINVLKSKPESVANPNTLKQKSQRNRLSIMVALYRLLTFAIGVGFKSRAIGKSAYNAFMSANIVPATTVDANGNAVIDFVSLKFALGTIGDTQIGNVNPVDAKSFNVDWDGVNVPVGGSASDIANVIGYCVETNEWAYQNNSDRQSQNSVLAFASDLPANPTVHLYLFFNALDSSDVSDSTYKAL